MNDKINSIIYSIKFGLYIDCYELVDSILKYKNDINQNFNNPYVNFNISKISFLRNNFECIKTISYNDINLNKLKFIMENLRDLIKEFACIYFWNNDSYDEKVLEEQKKYFYQFCEEIQKELIIFNKINEEIINESFKEIFILFERW